MHRLQALIILGIVTMTAPFIGLPYGWLMGLLPIVGFLSALLALTLSLKRRSALDRTKPTFAHDQSEGA